MIFEYKVVPFMGQVKRGFRNMGTAGEVSRQLQAVIDEHARQGWDFYSVEKINIAVSPGCFASLFGTSTALLDFDQIVFRRLIQVNATAGPLTSGPATG